jgi:RNA polymerase sigma-70 factor (ECF subfamily)
MDETPEPWNESYERLAPKLVLFARQWLPHPQDAEDVVQEAFIRVWKRRDAGRFNDAYFFAATRNAAIDHLRRSSRREQRDGEERALFEPMESPPALLPQDVEAALGALPSEQREAVVLRIWGGLSFAEIGEVTKANTDTAASRYRYGVSALRKFFEPVSP